MALHGIGLAAILAATLLTSRASDWEPGWLVGGLLVFAIVSHALALSLRTVRVTGAFSALVLAMVLLGPAPAVLVGFVTMLVTALHKGLALRYALSNFFAWTAFSLAGGLAARGLAVDARGDVELSLMVLAVYLGCTLLNFALIYGYLVLADGHRWWAGVRDVLAPVMPIELATGFLVIGVVYVDYHLGPGAIVLMSIVVLLFQYMLRTALQAVERGVQLEERNRQLAALQFGLISTTLKTLALRDHMTARHSAAVARYAREMGAELRLPETEQELFHTAGLFHDVGKFIFPDSILLADKGLTGAECQIVRQHPDVGADLIAEIEGYGAVAKVVRHHHERVDGLGYPAGLVDEDIPLASKVLAVADVYDVITARDTYREPVSTSEAFAELRRSAGTQLDADLVEKFIALVSRRGLMFSHSSADDFEAELALERRVSDYARPRARAV